MWLCRKFNVTSCSTPIQPSTDWIVSKYNYIYWMYVIIICILTALCPDTTLYKQYIILYWSYSNRSVTIWSLYTECLFEINIIPEYSSILTEYLICSDCTKAIYWLYILCMKKIYTDWKVSIYWSTLTAIEICLTVKKQHMDHIQTVYIMCRNYNKSE